MTAPERIKMTDNGGLPSGNYPESSKVEYIRADIARAEITQLRAELEQERELADRMYGALEYIDDYCLAYPELESISAVSSSAIEYVDTRRNK